MLSRNICMVPRFLVFFQSIQPREFLEAILIRARVPYLIMSSIEVTSTVFGTGEGLRALYAEETILDLVGRHVCLQSRCISI